MHLMIEARPISQLGGSSLEVFSSCCLMSKHVLFDGMLNLIEMMKNI